MRFLHVLLAIGLALGCIRARLEHAVVESWLARMLVVDMTITLLFGRPADFIVFARLICAFPWTLMRLDMFGQVTRPLEFFVAQGAFMNLRLGTLLAPCHRTEGFIFIGVDVGHVPLHRRSGKVLWRDLATGGNTYGLPVCPTPD